MRDKWLFEAFLVSLGIKFEALIQTIAPFIVNVGIIGANGNIEIDLLEKVGNATFDQQPTLDLWKFTFAKEDFADFVRHLRG